MGYNLHGERVTATYENDVTIVCHVGGDVSSEESETENQGGDLYWK